MKIILGTFKDNADELAAFLEPRLGATSTVGGGEMSFDDDKVKKTVRARHVKTYVKRFLNKKGERANYRILVEGPELRLIEIERDEEEEEKEEKAKEAPKVKEEKAPDAEERKEEQEASSVSDAQEKKDEALPKEASKSQTKPKRTKGD